MKHGPTRRDTLRSLVASVPVMGVAAHSTAAFAQGTIVLPDGPCKLTRVLTRSLYDGNQIRVARQWRIAFARGGGLSGDRITVRGQQLSVEVDAPPSLAQFSALEEGRSTATMWPILLTQSGLIVAAGRGIVDADVDTALQTARQMIAERNGAEAAAMHVRRLQAELQSAGTSLLDRLPDDLFFPTVGPLQASRVVELPGGRVGEFEVSYEAVAVPGKGWLDRAMRQVTTRLDGTEQTAREDWSLSPI